MTATQLKKKTKADLVTTVLDLQKQLQSLNDKKNSSRKAETTVKAFGKSLSLKESAQLLEKLDEQLGKEVKANIQLRNELTARDQFIDSILETYNKVKEALENIKKFIEDNKPYYFISFRKYYLTVKFVYHTISNLLKELKQDEG